jgi:membrane protein DedA with SNARE-associated domain
LEKKNTKKLLILTILAAIIFLIILWFLGNNILPSLREKESLFGIIIVSTIGALVIVGLIACYQFAKEYIHKICKKND